MNNSNSTVYILFYNPHSDILQVSDYNTFVSVFEPINCEYRKKSNYACDLCSLANTNIVYRQDFCKIDDSEVY